MFHGAVQLRVAGHEEPQGHAEAELQSRLPPGRLSESGQLVAGRGCGAKLAGELASSLMSSSFGSCQP